MAVLTGRDGSCLVEALYNKCVVCERDTVHVVREVEEDQEMSGCSMGSEDEKCWSWEGVGSTLSKFSEIHLRRERWP